MNKFAVKWTVGAVTVIACALGLAWLFSTCHVEPAPKIPVKVQKTLDSLDTTKPAFDQHRDSVARSAAGDTVKAGKTSKESDVLRKMADSLRLTADSLGQLAKQHADSAHLWEMAYEVRTHEADTLLVALTKKDSAYHSELSARIKFQRLYAADTLRRNIVEKANNDLKDAIKRLEQPCRILGPIKCPSRTVTMVLTAVTVAGIDHSTKK